MNIHERIKRARIAKGLSMEQVADALGIKSWQTIQQWENGKTAPNRKRAPAVAEVLGMSLEELAVGATKTKGWPFRLISEDKLRSLDDRSLAMVEMALALAADKYGIDIRADIVDHVNAASRQDDSHAASRK